jgi:hypothetical protein
VAYTITLTSPVETVTTGETYQVIFQITINTTGTNQSFTFLEKNMTVLSHGNLVWEYDIENALVLPNRLNVKIADGDLYLDSVLFGTGTEGLNSDIEFQVEIKINGTTEVKGNVLEDSISMERGDRILSFQVAPKTDQLNKLIMFDEDGNPKFSHGTASFPVDTEILNIFKKVNSSISSITFLHSWVFRDDLLNTHALTDSIRMTDLVFTVDDYSLTNLADALKFFCFFFGSMAGMVNNETAFFKELFRYDSSNTQTLGTVLDWHKTYKSAIVEWVKVVDPTTMAEGEEGSEDNSGIAVQSIRKDINESMWESTDTDPIGEVKIPSIDTTFRTLRAGIAKFWYDNRSVSKNQRVDRFKVSGVTYNLLKDFTYVDGADTLKYQPLGMEKNFEEGVTHIDALYLGV